MMGRKKGEVKEINKINILVIKRSNQTQILILVCFICHNVNDILIPTNAALSFLGTQKLLPWLSLSMLYAI